MGHDIHNLEPPFTINTVHSKMERQTLREVIKACKWKETKRTGEGTLIWYINSLREIDQKILNYRNCFYNRYPKSSICCRKRQFHQLMKKYQRFFPVDYDFIPNTYILPEDVKPLKKHLDVSLKVDNLAPKLQF